jgi:hypothetical protein
MSEHKTQPAASDSSPREAAAVAESLQSDNVRIGPQNWEGYSPDTLAVLLDP